MGMTRRQFIGQSAATIIAAGTLTRGAVEGANARIGMLCIGLNGQGGVHIREFNNQDGAEVVALCDPDRNVLAERAGYLERSTGKRPKTYTDIRAALQDPAVDAVSIAAPNHWHALATIWACASGKDVYVEKPMTHSIWEGPQVIAAARHYGRLVQHGTQSRSDARWLRDIKLLHEGIIGEVYMARGICYKRGRRGSIGFAEPAPPPRNLDWRLWQGPAVEQPYCDNYVHYNWHWFWRYGNGEIGNQGVHQMDLAMWGLNKGLPREVYSTGGRFTYEDQGETPNTQVATFNYDDGTMLVFEVRNRFTNHEQGVRVGNLFYGSEGYYVEGEGFFDTNDRPIRVRAAEPESKGPYGNFLDAVRGRDEGKVFATTTDGHLSSALCHLANISYRLGRSLTFDPEALSFPNDDEANELIRNTYHPDFEVPAFV